MSKIRIVIADDHRVVRDGIKSILADENDIEIIGEAINGTDAVEKVEELSPDILITDISMPEVSGIEAAHIINEQYPDTKVIILSMHENEGYINKVVEANVAGYLGKEVEKEEFVLAIRNVADGGKYFSENISKIMIDGYIRKSKQKQERNDSQHIHLTTREREILKLVVDGNSSKKIADTLYISTRTVETHRNNIMQKLNVKNSAELVRFAIENKYV